MQSLVASSLALVIHSGAAFADTWTGFYVGLSIGTVSTKDTWSSPGLTNLTANGRGGVGGVLTGFNWQSGSFLAGLETDLQFSGARGSTACWGPTYNCADRLTRLGSFRGRLGWILMPAAMVYFTGGLGWGSAEWKATEAATGSLTGGGSSAHTSSGHVLGGGAEFLVDKNWSVKAEYLHYQLGKFTPAATDFGGPLDFQLKADTFKVGANYKF